MHIGIMSGHFPRPSLGETLDAIRGHGIRHLQFNLSSAHLPAPRTDHLLAACDNIRREVEQRGMTIAAVGGPINMVEADAGKRGQAIERMATLINACPALGTSVIATCTGSRHPESMWRDHPDNTTDETWRCLTNTLEQLLPIAESRGVTLAFEPEVNNVASNAACSRRLIDELASPALGVVMDASNLFGKGDLSRMAEVLDEAFGLLGDHVALAHAKDLDHDGDAGHLAAGTGKLDYARYVGLLRTLPIDVSVILHGLAEAQVDESVAMLRGHMGASEPAPP